MKRKKTKETRTTNLTLTAIILLLAVLVTAIFVAGNMRAAEASVIEESAETITQDRESEGTRYPFEGFVNGSAVRFREEPNTSGKIFEEMRYGSSVTVTGFENGWYRVMRNGIQGFVKAEYVDRSGK